MSQPVTQFFSFAFRPMFLAGTLLAIFSIPWWLLFLSGSAGLPTLLPPGVWHAHEMLFGFVGAAVGGFLLTAVSNWTGRPPVRGLLLALILVAWIAGRVAVTVDLGLPAVLVMCLDAGYFALVLFALGREIVLARNWRNLKLVFIVACFFLLNLGFHAGLVFDLQVDVMAIVLRAVFMLTVLLISVIGGRIIPAFTANWLRLHQVDVNLPPGFNRFDLVVIMLTVLSLVFWTLLPLAPATGWVLLATGFAHLLRLARWQGHATLRDPLVVVLHVGYGWLGVGLLVLGGGIALPEIPRTAGIHAIGVGAFACLVMAVASRAAMGHTGRMLSSTPLLSSAFVAINLAALARIIATWFPQWLDVAGLLWVIAFVCFGVFAVPIVFGADRRIELNRP